MFTDLTIYRNARNQIAVVVEDLEIILPNGRVVDLECMEHAWFETDLCIDDVEITDQQTKTLATMASEGERLEAEAEIRAAKAAAEQAILDARNAEIQARRDAETAAYMEWYRREGRAMVLPLSYGHNH